jgi:hypothetical protein
MYNNIYHLYLHIFYSKLHTISIKYLTKLLNKIKNNMKITHHKMLILNDHRYKKLYY